MREYNRQQMASVQAEDAAANSPIGVNLKGLEAANASAVADTQPGRTQNRPTGALDLYGAALQAGANSQNADPNGQASKQKFFNQDIADLGYLPNSSSSNCHPMSLKRGSVIQATLVTGINSDLPGRITAQVARRTSMTARPGIGY